MVILLIEAILMDDDSIYESFTIRQCFVSRIKPESVQPSVLFKSIVTGAAGVAIASGVMIRKFSFGDEEKMVISVIKK